MEIPVPPPPSSAYFQLVAFWLFAGVFPLVYFAKYGWRKTLRYSSWCLIGTAPLVLPYLYAVQANSVEVAEGRIHVQAGLLYQLVRSVDSFKLDEAVAAPLRDIPQAQLSARLAGIGASGYSAGSFSLVKGGQAFVLLTDPEETVFLPSKAGASLLISVNDPRGLLELLRAEATRKGSADLREELRAAASE